ncbi:hypothetical protein [Streptomyces sp. NPDC090021]
MPCADTFEEFAYRFVVANELWMQAHSASAASPLAPRLRAYAGHYAPDAS